MGMVEVVGFEGHFKTLESVLAGKCTIDFQNKHAICILYIIYNCKRFKTDCPKVYPTNYGTIIHCHVSFNDSNN